MTHELPLLSFSANALDPWTSVETLEYHHGKHHSGYVEKLNNAIKDSELAEKSLEQVIASTRESDSSLFNLAAQHFNHSFFWNCLSPNLGEPEGRLVELIDRDFGSFEALKDQFSTLAGKHFGSGWVWLLLEKNKLVLRDFHDADTPAGTDLRPLLTLDVWEHAYYIDHRNDRAGFIKGFWDHVNWEFVAKQLV